MATRRRRAGKMTLIKIVITGSKFPRIGEIVKISNVNKWYKISTYAENLPTKDDNDNWVQYVYGRATEVMNSTNYDKILPFKATIEGP